MAKLTVVILAPYASEYLPPWFARRYATGS
jgi:hypothetical protein